MSDASQPTTNETARHDVDTEGTSGKTDASAAAEVSDEAAEAERAATEELGDATPGPR